MSGKEIAKAFKSATRSAGNQAITDGRTVVVKRGRQIVRLTRDGKEDVVRSLENLVPALELAYRAYVFDNSGRESTLLAEQTPFGNLNLEREHMPPWFGTYVMDRLEPSH
jgi:hypothetical protein